MSIIYEKIQQAAHEHEQLLRGLEQTDNAHPRLMQQTRYVDDLEVHMNMTAKRAERLKDLALIKLKEHEKYRDSTFRRFAHRASGNKDKFTDKAAKEEKEYLDAIKLQKSVEDELNHTKKLCDEAEERRKEIAAEAQHHKSLQARLDTLHNSIFAGPTPEFPEEDVKEDARDAAYAHEQSLVQRLQHQSHILSLLNQTANKLSAAHSELDRAYGASQYDMIGGGSFTSMRKLDHLDQAASIIRQVGQLQDQLRQTASSVPGLTPVDIPEGSFTMDVVFDNIFTDMAMHDEIKDSMAQLGHARTQCDDIIRQQHHVETAIRQQLRQAQHHHQNARRELQKVREQAFKSIMSDTLHHKTTTTTTSSTTKTAKPTPVRSNPDASNAPPPEYMPPEGPPPGYSG